MPQPAQARLNLIPMGGYNHKLPIIAHKVLDKIKTLQMDPARFELQRQTLERSYANSLLRQPYEVLLTKGDKALMDKAFHTEDYVDIITNLTLDQLQAWAPCLLEKGFIRAFTHGNVSEAEAISLLDQTVAQLQFRPLLPVEKIGIQRRMVHLPPSPCLPLPSRRVNCLRRSATRMKAASESY